MLRVRTCLSSIKVEKDKNGKTTFVFFLVFIFHFKLAAFYVNNCFFFQFFKHIEQLFPALVKTLTDPSDEVKNVLIFVSNLCTFTLTNHMILKNNYFLFNPFEFNMFITETCQLFYSANLLTGFYMEGPLVVNL